MSHELRTPLHAILGYADLLREGAWPSPARKEALDTIARQRPPPAGPDQRSARSVADPLRPPRAESRAGCSCPRCSRRSPRWCASTRSKKGLEFVLEIAGRSAGAGASRRQAPAPDPAQPARQRHQVHRRRAGDPGCAGCSAPPRAALNCASRWRTPASASRRKTRTRIFAPFEQSEEGQRRESGVGLGLAISQELAHLMGGSIEVESRPAAAAGSVSPSRCRSSRRRPVEHWRIDRSSGTRVASPHPGRRRSGGEPATAAADARAARLRRGAGRRWPPGARPGARHAPSRPGADGPAHARS